jgi:hypothetical protein
MLKIVLGVIAGFVAWSVLWIGSDQVLIMASPSWYGLHQDDFQLAMLNKDPFNPDATILVMNLIRAVIISIMTGFLAAFIAGENRRTPLILGILLFAFGLMVEIMAWNYLPIWYHLVFLALLIPFTVLGGRLKTASA